MPTNWLLLLLLLILPYAEDNSHCVHLRPDYQDQDRRITLSVISWISVKTKDGLTSLVNLQHIHVCLVGKESCRGNVGNA